MTFSSRFNLNTGHPLPRCEHEIVDPVTREFRLRVGKSLQCVRRARYNYQGKNLCGDHASPYALSIMVQEKL